MIRRLLTLPVIVSAILGLAAACGLAFAAAGTTGLLAGLVTVLLVALTAVLLLARDQRLDDSDERTGRLLLRRLDRIDEELRTVRANVNKRANELKLRVDPLRDDIRRSAARLDRRIGQVDHLIGLYHDLRPPTSFPETAGWAASPDLLRFLYDSVRDQGRSRILECGSGVSTLIMAYALRELGHGRVISLDHDEKFAQHTREVLERHDLDEWAEVRVAKLSEVELAGELWPWYDTDALPQGQFDLLFIDGPPKATRSQARFPAIPLTYGLLAENAMVVLDDHERVDEQAAGNRWVELFPDLTPEIVHHHKNTLVLRRGQ